ncbi:hypothetical protein GC177_03745 [bacterium]|nr:hypothetical protein [bacterium]
MSSNLILSAMLSGFVLINQRIAFMAKKIFSVGYEIPGDQAECIEFSSEKSLMDADILLINPDSICPSGDWVSFTSSDGGCYNVDASRKYKQKVSNLRKEIKDHLDNGQNVFILLSKERKYSLASRVSSPRKGQNTYDTELCSNYDFLPIHIGTLVSGTGKHVQPSGNPLFADFYKKFKEYLQYQLYIENINSAQIIFNGKDKNKILGSLIKVGAGNLVMLPFINYDDKNFTEVKKNKKGEGEYYWTSDALKFGHELVDCIVQIADGLNKLTEKTPPPQWINDGDFVSNKEVEIIDLIKKEEELIVISTKTIGALKANLSEEVRLKDLLFEQGKSLEDAVIRALKILGYKAEGYDDGVLELDQVIVSPEGYRYIGECEGKNEKDIDITKFRQLMDSINADFARDEIEDKAFGILFGNPQRLTDPNKRSLDFTNKCKISAERDKIALIKTPDLFKVAKYLAENTDDAFKAECRDAIHNGLGAIVIFPKVPA